MLRALHLVDCFTHKDRVISFDKGLTCITGQNEAGKSLILEMVAYAFFGSAALRGSADDYKNTKVTLEFVVKGKPYKVFRSKARVVLWDGDVEVAASTRVVNAAVKRILGYDYTVFCMANYCLQGQVEALGNMKPAERKGAIDQTIGLTVLDKVAAFADENSKRFATEHTVLSRLLKAPEEPTAPENYVVASTLTVNIDSLKVKVAELNKLRGWLSVIREAPIMPVPPCPENAATLRGLVEQRAALKKAIDDKNSERTKLQQPTLSDKEIAAAEAAWADYYAWLEAKAALAGIVTPQFVEETLFQYEQAWERYDAWQSKQRSLAGLVQPKLTREEISAARSLLDAEALYKRRMKLEAHLITCPACQHKWADADEWDKVKDAPKPGPINYTDGELTLIERQLSAWEASASLRERLESVEEAPIPTITKEAVSEARRQLVAWNASEELRMKYSWVAEVAEPSVSQAALGTAKKGLLDKPDWERLTQELLTLIEEFKLSPDREADYQDRVSYERALASYKLDLASYRAWQQEKSDKEMTVLLLEEETDDLDRLEDLYQQCHSYEIAVKRYHSDLAEYTKQVAEAQRLAEQAEDWAKAKKQVAAWRVSIKSFLLPGLNKVSSALLSQMTSGARQVIAIDEDFNILVDGQALATLSGSAKAVANLSIRLALGMVLTNSVFSVFMGDELDASMDAERAGATAAAMAKLTEVIGQVIIVSHKELDADHYVRL